MKRIVSILICVLFLHSIIFACSMSSPAPFPMAGFDRQSYIFVGEVIGYTETVKSRNEFSGGEQPDKFYGEGRGLKIKPLEIINLPNESKDYFELFRFGVTSWCAPRLQEAYPEIGSKIRVIATQATLLPNRTAENRIRLETKIFDRTTIVSDKDLFTTTADSVFDYKTLKPLKEKILETKDYENGARLDDFIYVEIVKDLIRLEKAKSKNERRAIFERLLYAPKIDYAKILNPTIGVLYPDVGGYKRIPNVGEGKPRKFTSYEKKLIERREELEKSGYFNH